MVLHGVAIYKVAMILLNFPCAFRHRVPSLVKFDYTSHSFPPKDHTLFYQQITNP